MAVYVHDSQFMTRRGAVLVVIIGLHVFIAWALATGLARRALEVIAPPIQTDIVQEVKTEKEPPPPPPPEFQKPPVEVPPPDVTIDMPVEVPPPDVTIDMPVEVPPPDGACWRAQAPHGGQGLPELGRLLPRGFQAPERGGRTDRARAHRGERQAVRSADHRAELRQRAAR